MPQSGPEDKVFEQYLAEIRSIGGSEGSVMSEYQQEIDKLRRPKRSFLERAGRTVAQFGVRMGEVLPAAMEGVANLIGDEKRARRAREVIETMRGSVGEPETAGEAAAAITGRMTGEAGMFLLPGSQVTKLPRVANMGRRAKTIAQLATDVPIDATLGASSSESTAQSFADLTDAEWLDRVAADPKLRAAFEAATGLALGTLITAAPGVIRNAREAFERARSRVFDLRHPQVEDVVETVAQETVEETAEEKAAPEIIEKPVRTAAEQKAVRTYTRAIRQLVAEEAEIQGAGPQSRVIFDNRDRTGDLAVGAVATGKGSFARGRRTQALRRAEDAKAMLEGDVPDPDVAFLHAIEDDPSVLRGTFDERDIDDLKQLGDDDLVKAAESAEEAAYYAQNDVQKQYMRAILAGEAKRRGLLQTRPGSAHPALLRFMGRTAAGATAGAIVADDEHKAAGLVTGAAVAAGAPMAGRYLKRLTASLDSPARDAYRRVIDDKQPLRDFGREVGGSERLSQEASRSAGWRGGAQRRLDSEFRGVVAAAKGMEDEVARLAWAERALELERNGLPGKYDLAQAQADIAALGSNPRVRAAVDQLRAYYRSLLEFKAANGVITPEQLKQIRQKGEFYVPFVRDFDDIPSAGGGRLVNRGTGVRKMQEGVATSAIVDPFEQAVKDTFEAHRTVAKQRVSNVVAQIVEENPEAAAPWIRKVSDRAGAKHGRIVAANIRGQRQMYEVIDPALYDAWASFDDRTQNIFQKVLAPFKRTLQAGVTLMPDFAVANALRDNAQSAIQYRLPVGRMAAGTATGAAAGAALDENDRLGGAFRGAALGLGASSLAPQIVRMASAMRYIIKNDDIYQQWVREGGSGFSEFYGTPEGARRMLAELRGDRTFWRTVMRPVDGLRSFGRMVEEAPRLARFKHMRAQGADIPEAIFSSRDISLDFANIGKDTRGVASVTAFFNAKLQGWDKLGRLLRNPKTWAVGAASLTAPSIALWSVNKDDPEYWDRPLWERNTFWLVPKPDGGFFRIPKPFEIGFLFGSIPERLLDFAYQRDPESTLAALGDMGRTAFSGTLPMPTALTPLIENKIGEGGFDFFRNREIVPRSLQYLDDEQQYDTRTSSVAVAAGKALNASPMKVENALRDWTGSAGAEALRATSALARATGIDERPAPPEGRAPLVGRFTTRDDQIGEVEIAIRRKFRKAEQAYNTFRELAESGDTEAAREYVRNNRRRLAAYAELKEKKDLLDEVGRARRQLAEMDIDRDQKQRILTRLNRRVAELLGGRAAYAN